jgi:competence protein ComEC
MDAGLIAMLDVAHWVASWPLASIGVPSFPIEALLAMSLGLCWLAGSRASWRWLGLVPVLAGLAAGAISPRPDILVAANAGNMAVRDASGSLSFASARKARFDAEMWLRADGDSRDLSSALASRNSAFACGHGLCLARLGDAGPLVALAAPDATRVACRKASLVIVTGEAADRCKSNVTQIDQATLSRTGAIAIHLNGNAMKITSASDVRGKRPWVAEAR